MLLASGTTQAKTKCCCWGMPRTCYVIKHDASVGLHLEAGLALACGDKEGRWRGGGQDGGGGGEVTGCVDMVLGAVSCAVDDNRGVGASREQGMKLACTTLCASANNVTRTAASAAITQLPNIQ
jgi:hypothetical protein